MTHLAKLTLTYPYIVGSAFNAGSSGPLIAEGYDHVDCIEFGSLLLLASVVKDSEHGSSVSRQEYQ